MLNTNVHLSTTNARSFSDGEAIVIFDAIFLADQALDKTQIHHASEGIDRPRYVELVPEERIARHILSNLAITSRIGYWMGVMRNPMECFVSNERQRKMTQRCLGPVRLPAEANGV